MGVWPSVTTAPTCPTAPGQVGQDEDVMAMDPPGEAAAKRAGALGRRGHGDDGDSVGCGPGPARPTDLLGSAAEDGGTAREVRPLDVSVPCGARSRYIPSDCTRGAVEPQSRSAAPRDLPSGEEVRPLPVATARGLGLDAYSDTLSAEIGPAGIHKGQQWPSLNSSRGDVRWRR